MNPLFKQRWFYELVAVVLLLLAFNYELNRARVAERAVVRAAADAEIAQIQSRMSERDKSIKFMAGEIVQRETIVRAQQLQIDVLMSRRPNQTEVTERVQAQTQTDLALIDAAQSIAGVTARVASVCK